MAFNLSELATMDAIAQAELLRRRELTPLELVDAAIAARIERVNPSHGYTRRRALLPPQAICQTVRFVECRFCSRTLARCRKANRTT